MRRPLAILLLCAAHLGCSGNQGLAPPDLSEQQSAIDAQTRRFEDIARVMADDLTEVGDLRRAFFGISVALYSPPFPLDLFKLTALNCFNEPVADDAPSDQPTPPSIIERRLAADRAISCRPDLIDECLSRVDEVCTDKQFELTVKQLERVDRFRRTRATLRARTNKVDVIVSQARNRIARARADLRQQRKQVRGQEADYGQVNFDEAQRRLDAYAARLDANAAAIDELEKISKTWPGELQKEVNAFTLELVALRLER